MNDQIAPVITPPTEPKHSNSLSPKFIAIGIVCIIVGLSFGAGIGWLFKGANQQTINNSNMEDATNKPFLIGFITPLSGDGASYGVPAKQAAIVIANEINETGGIGGRKIELLFEDGRCGSIDAKAAAEKLVNENKIDLLYGGGCSDEFLASAPIAQKKKVFTVSSSATSPKISELGKYIYRVIPSDSLAGKAAAQYAYNKLDASSAAVIAENTNYALQLRDVFINEFERLGGKIKLTMEYDTGNTDFKDFVNGVKEQKPAVVYMLPQTPTPGVLIVKALKAAKLDTNLLTAEVLLTRDEIPKQGQILDGLTGIEAFIDETNPKAKHVVDLYKKEYGQESQYPTDLVSINDILYIYKEAYEKVGKDPDKINDYITSLKNWNGAAGEITFDKNGDVVSLPYAIQRIKDKEVTLIETFKVNQ
jgi:branched-chain amino acid transport system substrate-binding protein